MPAASNAPPARLAAGRVVGGFRLDGLLGRGAMGEVHLATELASGVKVALKLLPLAAASAEVQSRFAREAGAAQRLLHADIVRVFGAGTDGGHGWIAMEPLGGCDLVRYTRPARLLPEAVALQVVERLARALAYAHGMGVIHRDVKPANVMVDWAAGRVVLTDFGIARVADAERTRTGVVLGSPDYMAPEQLAGAEASAAGDVYALGVMLFELLCGRRPYQASSLGDLLRQVAQQPAPALDALRPDLPPPLSVLLARVLAKHPGDRPAGAAALADALAPLRRGLERTAAPASGAKSRP